MGPSCGLWSHAPGSAGFKYYVHEPYVKKASPKIKSYGAKFSWSAKTRTNTK